MTRRLLVGYLVITLLVLAVLEVPLGINYADGQLDRVTNSIEADAVAIGSLAEDRLERGAAGGDLVATVQRYQARTGRRVVIVDDSGLAIADSDPPAPGTRSFATRPEIAAALAGQVSRGTRESDTLGARNVYVAVPVASGGVVHGAVRITYPTAGLDARIRRYWLLLGLVALITIAVVVGAGWFIARGVARPLHRLRDAAGRLGRGDFAARAPDDSGPPEVRAVATSFNRTAARLHDVLRRQEAFVADASHQLRTPLTALRLRLESLEDEITPDGRDDLEAATEEVDRLSRLVDGLLALARAERADGAAHRVALDATELLAGRAAVWRPFAEDHQVALAVDARDGLRVRADPDHLVQVLDNLVANALDAAPPGTTVTLHGTEQDGQVALHVVDEGPGMTDEERQRAVDRFWRADSQPARFGGSGLGLAIVDQLVRASDGTLELRAAHPSGLDAVVLLPRAEPAVRAAFTKPLPR